MSNPDPKLRPVFRFTATEIKYEDLKAGDLFVLDKPTAGVVYPCPIGADLCYAVSDPAVLDDRSGVLGIEAVHVGVLPKPAFNYAQEG